MFLVALLLIACAPALAELRAGAAKADITPDLGKHPGTYVAGFGQNRVATGIHDRLYAACLALSTGKRPLVMCGVDSIGLFLEDVEKARRQVGQADLVVAATHNHNTPDTMGLWGRFYFFSGISEAYNQMVVDRIAEAARRALSSMEPAVLTLAKSQTGELEGLIHDNRPPVVRDPELVVLAARSLAGRTIGALVNWANHPETLGSKNTLITADYTGYLTRRLEGQLGGTAVFINGAVGGLQSTLGVKVKDPETGKTAPDNSFEKTELIGRRVADHAIEALRQAKPTDVDDIVFQERKISIPVSNFAFRIAAFVNIHKGRKPRNPDGTTTTFVGVIRMKAKGACVLEIALVPGEIYPELSQGGVERYPGADFPDAPIEPAIKQMMTAPYRMLFGLADDEIGYIIPKAEWDNSSPWLKNAAKRWYGEINSVGPEAAPRITRTLQDLFGQAPR